MTFFLVGLNVVNTILANEKEENFDQIEIAVYFCQS